MIYTKYLWYMEQMIHNQYDISSTIRHKGEKGRQREDGLAQFLRDNLPESYGIATGELIASEGDESSPQCDIIIYDKLYMPIIGKSSSVQQVPIEGTYAVIEVKSILNSNSLNDAKRKYEQIWAMPRCEPKTTLQEGKRRGLHYYLFGYRFSTTIQACIKLAKETDGWNDISIFALDKGGIVWVTDQKDTDDEFVSDTKPIWVNSTTQQKGKNSYYTLGLFFIDLLSKLQEIDLGRVSFLELIGLRQIQED